MALVNLFYKIITLKIEGFYLSAMCKGSNVNKEICYLKDSQLELEGLIYILNKRINNINI